MPLRYLFGPVSPEFAHRHLSRPRDEGRCLCFGPGEGLDLPIGFFDTWESVRARFPEGWEPDLVALNLAFTSVPPCLWSVPIPLVGLAPEWRILWHHYRHCLPACDLVFTDSAGAQSLTREGLTRTRATGLLELAGGPFPEHDPAAERDTDLLIVRVSPSPDGLPSDLAGLIAWSSRWRMAVCGLEERDACERLARSRVVIARASGQDRALLARACAAAGTLLLLDGPGLSEHVQRHLEDEHYRRAAVAAARAEMAGDQDYATVWEGLLEKLEAEKDSLQERVQLRAAQVQPWNLAFRTGQALCSLDPQGDPRLIDDLAGAVARQPRQAELHNALGLVLAREAARPGLFLATTAARVAEHFQRAAADPRHVLAGLNLAEALVALEQPQAADQARQTLRILEAHDEQELLGWDSLPFPPLLGVVRLAWEQAAWENAGDREAELRAKKLWLRWRLHTLLASLSESRPGQPGGTPSVPDLCHYHEAALARPDLPGTRASLGCALARAGRIHEALPHLRQAVTDDPFDADAARALYHALGEVGNDRAQRRLAHQQKTLATLAPGLLRTEAWFENPPPVGDELTSIIILCCNEVNCSRTCLESVLANTRPSYELILVDNGSTDATPALLEELKHAPGPDRVEVIRNESNAGFAAGCNQGRARARGDYIVFLNNDTIVTEGWLDGLIRCVLSDWPQVGMAGAVTNNSRPPQQVPAPYADRDGLESFAAQRRREHAGAVRESERLAGFCLLARRQVLDRVGSFDEGYGVGFFEDDDLCVRVRQAGYRLLVALDVFVHHFGSRTFRHLGIDTEKQLRENFEKFRARWGEEHTRGYRLPGEHPERTGASSAAPVANPALSLSPGRTTQARVSLCMIVKNEEHNLPDCLRSVLDLVDEAIVVDTGSTDRTRDVARSFGPRVRLFDFPWPDSFAVARNHSLEQATGDWIFWMDADDRLDPDNREKLRRLFATLGTANVAYTMKCLCLPDPESRSVTAVDHIRLFRNHPELRWEYRVHEQILPAVRRLGGEVRWADVVVHHTGYQDNALRARKLQRDLRLLQLDLKDRPDEPFLLFNLGASYAQELGRYAEAIPLLRRSLERSDPSASIVRKLYALLAHCHKALGQGKEALTVCREGQTCCPGDTELLFTQGQLLADLGEWTAAESCCLELLSAPPARYFASVDAGLRGYKGRHLLATIHQRQGRHDLARAQWELAVAERPDFLPGWLGLADGALACGDGEALEAVARKLEEFPDGKLRADLLRTEGLLARRDLAGARERAERLATEHPREVGPRLLLSRILLEEGTNREAAEKALRDVLLLDPTHAEAQRNLSILLPQVPGGAWHRKQ
jgi:GT2 family glycosyltransferase